MIPRLIVGVAFAVVALIGAANATIVTNGDFATGDFTGWTLFTTPNGTLGPSGSGLPAVTSFDVTGSGAQNAATFQVGEVVSDMTQQGGGIMQTVTLPGGVISFSASIAAQFDFFNDEFGVFSVLLDGVAEDTVDFGTVNGGTVRDTLSFTTTESAGAHTLEILITRPFTSTPDSTPLQYVTNIAISGAAAVPEPTSLALLAAGLLGFAAVRRPRS
jgi:PEP-CTERM motif